MNHCTVKHIEWVIYGSSIRSKDGCFEISKSPSIIQPCGPHTSATDEWSLKFTSPCGQNIRFSDTMHIIEAKARAQEIWNDYLKQYLEEVK